MPVDSSKLMMAQVMMKKWSQMVTHLNPISADVCGCRFTVDLFLDTANHLITVTADTQYCTCFEITCHVNFNLK